MGGGGSIQCSVFSVQWGREAMTAFARSYQDLIVCQKARSCAREIFACSKAFPFEERYSLTDQVRRSSRSVGAQIAEAWAKRQYPSHFSAKLSDADGEKNEIQHWLDTALDCGYLSSARVQELHVQLGEVGRMLQHMMDRADDFKGEGYGRVREESACYGGVAEFFVKTGN